MRRLETLRIPGVAVKRLLRGVQGQVGTDEPQPEVRVVRVARCRLEQKAGYGLDAEPI